MDDLSWELTPEDIQRYRVQLQQDLKEGETKFSGGNGGHVTYIIVDDIPDACLGDPYPAPLGVEYDL